MAASQTGTHLTVPRKHVETITVGGEGSKGQAPRDVPLKLGTWVDNQRRRAATLTPERVEQLSKIGMRWGWALTPNPEHTRHWILRI
ncbi:helicase associated domain-containing protein [Streptomyces sp. NPDC001549]|uniref:helicase associated domain-containing protein n=1 Tax=Streptomyces sp. NPDC001549 TaxID=3364586 RepID=UPI003684FA2D